MNGSRPARRMFPVDGRKGVRFTLSGAWRSLTLWTVLMMAALASPLADAAPSTIDGPGTDQLTGYLTWSAGRGGISWSSEPSTEDPGGPTDPGTDWAAKNSVDANNDVVDLNPTVVTEFVSSPLQETLYLNGARKVQVDLALTNCAGFDYGRAPMFGVELLAGESRIASALAPTEANYWPSYNKGFTVRPTVPQGYCLRWYRMQAETDVLPAGTQVTLRVTHSNPSAWHRYGLGAGHWSVIRLPFFPLEEAAYRFPEIAGLEGRADVSTVADPGAGSGTGAWSAFVGVASCMAPFRWRRRGGMAVLAAVAVLAAGCADSGPLGEAEGDEDASDGGLNARASILRNDGNKTGLGNQTFGTIAARALSDYQRPVEGVEVGLEGTGHFSKTNRYGIVGLHDVKPGDYVLYALHDAYEPIRLQVNVEAQSITKVEMQLVSKTTEGSVGKPHPHPKWDATGKELVMQQSIPFDASFELFDLPDGKTIFPGTRRVEVTVDWQSENLEAVWLEFHWPEPTVRFENFSKLGPRPSGVPFNIATTWEMADSGHQEYSLWKSFTLHAIRSYEQSYASTAVPFSVDVTVTLYQGVVPMEPPHEDFWKGRTEIVVVNRTRCDNGHFDCTWVAEDFVPPGTASLEMTLELGKQFYQALDTLTVQMGDRQQQDVVASGTTVTTRTFRMDLEAEQTDPFYAKEPSFRFRRYTVCSFTPDPNDPTCTAQFWLDWSTLQTGTPTVWLTVKAYKDTS